MTNLNTTLSKRGYSIVKSELSSQELQLLRKDLTVKPYVNQNYPSDSSPFPVFMESYSKLYLPRYYGFKKFGKPKKNRILDGDPININFTKQLRENQIKVVDTYLEAAKDQGGGIISVPCGYGKTVIALHIAARLKMKTLIIVHKEFLMNQWKERISQFLENYNIGTVQKNIFDIEDKNVVLGMLQTISQKDFEEDAFSSFGLVIFDECHHLGAEVFSRALFKTACKHTIGLSATPKRNDGLQKIFEWYLGDIVFQIKKRKQETVNVKIIKYYSEDDEYSKIEINYQNKPNTSKMMNNICDYIPRNNLILDEIKILVKENRKTLILSNRKSQLKFIKDQLDENNICSTGYYLGGMKEAELKISETKQIMLATFSMAEEGLDCKDLDSVILVSPKSNIEQAVGRILRKEESKRNKIPLVVDIFDNFSVFDNQCNKRLKFYKKNKYNTRQYNMNNEEILVEKPNAAELSFI
jgi:superfamily II DNA or RNA helicase